MNITIQENNSYFRLKVNSNSLTAKVNNEICHSFLAPSHDHSRDKLLFTFNWDSSACLLNMFWMIKLLISHDIKISIKY